MAISKLWTWLVRGGDSKSTGRHDELAETLKEAQQRNLQAHDLLQEALESLVDVHVADERARSDSDSV